MRWNKSAAAETAIVVILAAAGAGIWRVAEIMHESDIQFLRRTEFASCIRSAPPQTIATIRRRDGMPIATFPVELNADRRPVVLRDDAGHAMLLLR